MTWIVFAAWIWTSTGHVFRAKDVRYDKTQVSTQKCVYSKRIRKVRLVPKNASSAPT